MLKYIFRKISRRKLLLVFIDAAVLTAAINISSYLWVGSSNYLQFYIYQIIGTIIIQILVLMISGLYEINNDNAKTGIIFKITGSVIVASAAILMIFFFFPELKSPSRPIFLINIFVKTVLLYTGRRFYAKLFGITISNNVLILGTTAIARAFVREFKELTPTGYKIIGFIDDKHGTETHFEGYEIFGNTGRLKEIVKEKKIDLVIVSLKHHERNEEFIKNLISCMHSGIEVEDISLLYEEITGRIPYEHLNDAWFLDTRFGAGTIYRRYFKKILGKAIAAVILLITSPVFIIALLYELVFSGKVFYTQERLGKFGKKFKIIKFRTMKHKAEEETGPVWVKKDDPRITRFGRFLRITRIDELPQLINVLKGDMSLVGPRPEREHFIRKFQEEIPFYTYRLTAFPGITGWAQINWGYDASVEDVKRKLEYDLYYIKNKSFVLDLVIILRTLQTVFTAKGR
ncbi:MAG: hypothetical protein A2252_07515 [Elusimicrobia bacterium RIFOXYA2_FULL_39_19]|nr:MAG: hypothetical protein A2252_07515 [Elusimicrobia bacterium RIFOXYA2_FULL_39_19]